MTKSDQVRGDYFVVLEQMAARLTAAKHSLAELMDAPEHPNAWSNCDFIALQVRKLCELAALGSSLAHLRGAGAEFDTKNWHPKDIVRELEGVNEYPLPFPITVEFHKNGQGQHHATPVSKALGGAILVGIHGRCGDLLHVPSAHRVLNGRLGAFEVDRFRGWLDGWEQLLRGHMLVLPEIQNVLVCLWSGDAGAKPECFYLGGEGEAVFDTANLPEFGLLAA